MYKFKNFQDALNVCRLRRRKQNLNLVLDKLELMFTLHQAQPNIQQLLSGNEFSGNFFNIFVIFLEYENLSVFFFI